MAEDAKPAKAAAKTVEPPVESRGSTGGATKPRKAAEPKQRTVKAGGHVVKVDPVPESTLPPKLCSVHGVRYEGDKCPESGHESGGWGVEDDGG